jgi:hypothetical protein
MSGQWEEDVDPESGHTYYINSRTGETQWEKPPGYRKHDPSTTYRRASYVIPIISLPSLSLVLSIVLYCIGRFLSTAMDDDEEGEVTVRAIAATVLSPRSSANAAANAFAADEKDDDDDDVELPPPPPPPAAPVVVTPTRLSPAKASATTKLATTPTTSPASGGLKPPVSPIAPTSPPSGSPTDSPTPSKKVGPKVTTTSAPAPLLSKPAIPTKRPTSKPKLPQSRPSGPAPIPPRAGAAPAHPRPASGIGATLTPPQLMTKGIVITRTSSPGTSDEVTSPPSPTHRRPVRQISPQPSPTSGEKKIIEHKDRTDHGMEDEEDAPYVLLIHYHITPLIV